MALPAAAETAPASRPGDELWLFIGDDWAEDHHNVELMAEDGRVLARARLPEGVEGMARLHAMVAGQAGEAGDDNLRVLAGIELTAAAVGPLRPQGGGAVLIWRKPGSGPGARGD
jgi:hypothetical protein